MSLLTTKLSEEGTYDFDERDYALLYRDREVAWDDTLHSRFLRGAKDLLLRFERHGGDGADEDGDALDDLLERVQAVREVANADLHTGGAEVLCCRLRD